MTANCVAQLLVDFRIMQSLGRPRILNDNPYSEADVKPVKYHPGCPGRFVDIEEAKALCRTFFQWYLSEHRHRGIGLLTPQLVHFFRVPEVIESRRKVLATAQSARSDRFVDRPPTAAKFAAAGWINRALAVTAVDGTESANGEKEGPSN